MTLPATIPVRKLNFNTVPMFSAAIYRSLASMLRSLTAISVAEILGGLACEPFYNEMKKRNAWNEIDVMICASHPRHRNFISFLPLCIHRIQLITHGADRCVRNQSLDLSIITEGTCIPHHPNTLGSNGLRQFSEHFRRSTVWNSRNWTLALWVWLYLPKSKILGHCLTGPVAILRSVLFQHRMNDSSWFSAHSSTSIHVVVVAFRRFLKQP